VIVAIESHQGALHMQISTIGLDIAKNVFQVHGIDASGASQRRGFVVVAPPSQPVRSPHANGSNYKIRSEGGLSVESLCSRAYG
jgi:hypothetical protein